MNSKSLRNNQRMLDALITANLMSADFLRKVYAVQITMHSRIYRQGRAYMAEYDQVVSKLTK